VLDGKGQANALVLQAMREFRLGANLEPGEYDLKITAIDENAPHGSGPVSRTIGLEIN
jgi:hypothetical protein